MNLEVVSYLNDSMVLWPSSGHLHALTVGAGSAAASGHHRAWDGRLALPHAVQSPLSLIIWEANSSLCLTFPQLFFWGSAAPAIISVLFLDFMVSFQDLVAFQQAEEHLGCVALQSYLEIIAEVNQKQGET